MAPSSAARRSCQHYFWSFGHRIEPDVAVDERVEDFGEQVGTHQYGHRGKDHSASCRFSYAAGAATQVDVIQAERDVFGAEVSQIQARTELATARASLRISAALPLE